ncbi:MAG: hypothetical protein HOV80_12205 [Polyangiaceae bacterium]|nr:hypothetical protein [Polyangiaceae bacterium]
MNKEKAFWLSSALVSVVVGACSAGQNGGFGGSEDGAGAQDAGTTVTVATATAGQGGSGSFTDTTVTGMQAGCDAGPDEDKDEDGFTINNGDCNDCDANVNPAAIEVIDDGMGGGGGSVPADEDCDMMVDNVADPCDMALPIDGTNPLDAAKSIELCKQAAGPNDWGVVSAQWVRANGTPAVVNAHMGILPDFGPNVATRKGDSMLAVSSGAARDATDPGFCSHSCSYNGVGTPPPGFPQDVPSCAGSTNINDDVGLDVTLRAPTNATGYSFDFRFYSNEYPEWVCTSFNDQFIALVNPAPMGSINGNISFDSMANPVSVNVAFFDVCQGCPAGTAELQGTGFADAEGGTTWLQTSAPITGGETFSIRFAIWDTGDTAYDSTTLIDNFSWIANGGTVNVGTIDVPE